MSTTNVTEAKELLQSSHVVHMAITVPVHKREESGTIAKSPK